MDSLVTAIVADTNIIALEQQMLEYLTDKETEKHHQQLGWSRRLPRWHRTMPINRLHRRYTALYRETRLLESVIKQKQATREEECEHVWEKDWSNRDERSHYMCTVCGKSR